MPGLTDMRADALAHFDPARLAAGEMAVLRMHGEQENPLVSAIVPTLDGRRDGNLYNLLQDLIRQDFASFEIIIVKGVRPQGRAINMGAQKARADLLIILDDDSRVPREDTFTRLAGACRDDAAIGMAGASVVISPESNAFQQKAAKQFPRFNMPVVEEITESDMASHGCCAIPKSLFYAIGRENEKIVRGLDPDLRHRLRTAGYKTVLVPHAYIYHPLAPSLPKLMKLFYRNGKGSAHALLHDPKNVFDTHDKARLDGFSPRSTFAYRLVRFPMRLLRALIMLRGMRCAAYSAYAVGFVAGLWRYLPRRRNA